MLVTRRVTVDSTKIFCAGTNHIQIKLPVPFNIRRIQTFLLLKNWLCNCPSATVGNDSIFHHVPVPLPSSKGWLRWRDFWRYAGKCLPTPRDHSSSSAMSSLFIESRMIWRTLPLQWLKKNFFKVEKGPYMHMSSFSLCASWLMFLCVNFSRKRWYLKIHEDTIYSLFWSQHKSARFLQHRSMDHRILAVICWANPMISICPIRRLVKGLRRMQLSRIRYWRDSFWMKQQEVSQKRHKIYWNLIMIPQLPDTIS